MFLAQNKGDAMFFNEIKPYARYVRFLDIKTYNQLSHEVTPLDNRLFYVLSGTGLFKIGGQITQVPSGSVLYIHSGVSYAHLPCDANYLAINFDFLQEKRHLTSPIPPCEKWENEELVEDVKFFDYTFLNSFLLFKNCQHLEEIFRESEKEFITRAPLFEQKLSLKCAEILINLIRKNEQATSDEGRFDAEKIADFVRKNLKENLDNKTLAKKFHFHPNYLSSEFAKYFGKPLHRYILESRILKAISLLESGNENIAFIAQSVGFENGNYFSRYFKKVTGASPKYYLKKR